MPQLSPEPIQEGTIHADRLAALGELAAGLAHEVNNPLDGMQECVRYLEADPNKSERMRKYLPMLRDGLGRIASVMQQMLIFARSSHDLPDEPLATRAIVEEMMLMVEAELQTRQIRLSFEKPGGCACLCNRYGLSQALLNLTLNAADAVRGQEDPRVLVTADCDSDWVYLTVEDSGPGVADAIREQIFDPFFTTKPVTQGTGLGLAISRQLIRAMGGELELATGRASLGGACFRIQLPRADRGATCHA